MVQIILSKEQVKAIHDAAGGIELLDWDGHSIGVVNTGISGEDLRIVRQRMASHDAGLTTEQLLGRLRALRPQSGE